MTYQITQLQPAADTLKREANDAFHAKDFGKAIALYDEAISVQSNAEVLYSNRSAAKLAKGDWRGALQDADKAVAIAPKWAKAHVRRSAALSAGGRTMGALYAMHHAVKLEYTAETDNRFQQCYEDWINPRHLSKPPRTLDDQLSLGDKCADEVAFAFAGGFGLALPENATGADAKRAVLQRKRSHPGNSSLPIRRGLYLPAPEDFWQAESLIEIDPSKGSSPKNWEEVLNCKSLYKKVIYSENQMERWRGNPAGVGIGYLYRTYHIVMDGTVPPARRVPNQEAAKLLRWPEAYGPVLVMKVTRLNNGSSHFAQDEYADAVSWEAVTREELESEEWQEMRREYDEMPKHRRQDTSSLAGTGPL